MQTHPIVEEARRLPDRYSSVHCCHTDAMARALEDIADHGY
ncbi:hypothetical protein Thi970DRAFT_03771 [Thiorhodovibrio frisius]|uniref:Uncharacterized protein n=1 Tax=Thiorhodovibrio frisius TaxID=631362 RepID=H8Z492_9GAMM|nr:hypothetical protein Thi970DRAFT_03771 [Thiorhodovibrio frisius]